MPDRQNPAPVFLNRLVGLDSIGVAYMDRRLIFRFCNDVQARYFGRTIEHVVGVHLHDVVPDNPAFWSDLERVIETGVTHPQTALDVTWTDRAGEGEHHYLVAYVADRDEAGVRGVFMTAQEVTVPDATRETETDQGRLTERIRSLEAEVKEKDVLIGMISHEMRTPLTTIYGDADILARRLDDLDAESRSRAIGDIRTEAQRLGHLVENMLLFARASSHAPVESEPVLLVREISQVASERQTRLGERPVTISVIPEDLIANANPRYFEQVLHNLLGNAEKYSPPDEPIEVRAVLVNGEVIVSVLDRGPGIDPAEADMIFQPFYRSEGTSREVAGAGIGLAVCKLLVQAQSGRIWVNQRESGGSIFSFALPAEADVMEA